MLTCPFCLASTSRGLKGRTPTGNDVVFRGERPRLRRPCFWNRMCVLCSCGEEALDFRSPPSGVLVCEMGRTVPASEGVKSVDANKKDVGGHPEHEVTGPERRPWGRPQQPEAKLPLAFLPWSSQPRGGSVGIPAGGGRAGPRGQGLRSPFQATMFQICEQYPPLRSISQTLFLLEFLSPHLPLPPFSP